MPKVYNKRHGDAPADAVYVGRPSKFGNPYPMSGATDRTAAIALYRRYLEMHPQVVRAAKAELRNKDLVCWCHPEPCHADILLEIANQPEE